jgi:hypothetical protein
MFGIVSLHADLSAHGMAFLVAPSKNFSTGLPRQYLGLFNPQNNGKISNHVFAIELDTNLNKEFHDINNNHAGIDVNGLQSVQSHDAGYYDDKDGMFHNLTLASHEIMQVWVDYDSQYKNISVTIAPFKMTKPIRPLITATYNLSEVLTDPSYIGFSAATSPINSRHYVLGWSFGMNRPAHESRQGMKEFVAEVVSIGRLRHRNLVRLLGYCRRKDELLLVYDYMSNGSTCIWMRGKHH